jgi:hypothetical protein
MSNEISYGGYLFPHPHPFLALSHSPVIVKGVVDHSILQASLVGEFTGCNFTNLKIQKDNLIKALSTGFQTLNVGEKEYNYAQPISVDFSSSNIRNRLPYSIEFTIQNDTDFSEFYGIKSPVDTWSFSETEDRTVSATHTVSAYGVKISGDSLDNARNFVNSRLNGFDNNNSITLSGSSPILLTKNEEINRVSNFYSITETWKYSISQNGYDKEDSIVRADCSIDYSADGSLNVTVKGKIEGGISGSADSGSFTKIQAQDFAKNVLSQSKSSFEDDLYGSIFQEPKSFSYNLNTGSNNIDFTYNFGDPTDTRLDEVLHDYTTSIKATKDSALISASVNGNIYYNKTNNPNTGGSPEVEYRFTKVNEYFNKINPFALALEGYSFFNQASSDYTKNNLSNSVISYNVSKNPFDSKITYNYEYNNNVDFLNGNLLNTTISINTDQEFVKYGVNQTIDNSFAVQNLYTSNKQVAVTVNGQKPLNKTYEQSLAAISGYIEQFSKPNGFVIGDTVSSGDNKISITKTFFFK